MRTKIKTIQDLERSQIKTPARPFNKLIYENDTATKIIFNKEKGLDELFFYENIPEAIKEYFPNLKSKAVDHNKVQYSMDMIKQLDLSILYNHNLISPHFLKTVFSKIDDYFLKCPTVSTDPITYRKVFANITYVKLEKRWENYAKSKVYSEVYNHFIENENTNIEDIKNDVSNLIQESISKLSSTDLIFAHGDMCFSNILIGPETSLKLIDPRGAQKFDQLFLPLHYDLAKLSQCINGNYDGILKSSKTAFEKQAQVFSEWIEKKNIDLKLIRLIEASLFLSLIPLHKQDLNQHIDFIYAAIDALQFGKQK